MNKEGKMKDIRKKIIEVKKNKLYEEFAKVITEIKLAKTKKLIEK